MAPIFSKFIKLKSGQKIPINESNIRAIVKLSKPPKSRKVPVKHVPRPGRDSDLNQDNDPELAHLIAAAEQRRLARVLSENQSENRPEIDQNQPQNDQNRPEIDQNRPEIDENRPENDQNRPNNNENIFEDDIDPFLEPDLELKDVTLAQRAELLLLPGTDKCKRNAFFLKHYPNFWRYYEVFDCWSECPIKSEYSRMLKTDMPKSTEFLT